MRRIPAILVVACLLAMPTVVSSQAKKASLSLDHPTAKPIDFKSISKKIATAPEFVGEPLYGLLLFGLNGEKKVWTVLDKSRKNVRRYDRLYLDLNANGDLTEPGELFKCEIQGKSGRSIFKIGKLKDPGTGAVHTDFTMTWRLKTERMQSWTSFKMKWRGEKITMGPYGPYNETYQGFAKTPEEAPIMVPGYDRPFQFQHWMSEKLNVGRSTKFKVFVGNRGDRTGTFTCVDDKFLARNDSPKATLIYSDRMDKKQRQHMKLVERC